MKKLLLIVCTIPLFSMEQKEVSHSRSDSITITFNKETQNKHPIAYKLVHSALNGHTDDHIVNAIGMAFDHDKDGFLYDNLKKKRQKIKDLLDSENIDRDKIIKYLVKELVDVKESTHQEAKSQTRQKYITALIGAATTVLTTIATSLSMYFSGND